jgi:hypothetical protein
MADESHEVYKCNLHGLSLVSHFQKWQIGYFFPFLVIAYCYAKVFFWIC